MNNSIDWYAIVDSVGNDADKEQFVTMPAASRLLLMEMATAFYGRYNRSGMAEPQEMYEYLSIGQKALAREDSARRKWDWEYYVRKDLGAPGLDYVGDNKIKISGLAFKISTANVWYIPVFFRNVPNLENVYAFSCTVVTAVCTTTAYFYLWKEQIQTLTANVAISGKYIVKLNSYEGSTTGYDVVKQVGYTDVPFFQTFAAGTGLANNQIIPNMLFGLRPFTTGAIGTVELDDIRYLDKYGNDTIF
jgi:hypothetical protein